MTTWPTLEGLALAEVLLLERKAQPLWTISVEDARELLAASTWAVETLPKLRALEKTLRARFRFDCADALAALLPKEE